MSELLHIHEPEPSPSRPQWRAFLELGFRPLYMGGCAWAAVSLAVWMYAPGWLTSRLFGVVWHAHEMLWGFIATIAVGFLLTAVNNWTGVNPLSGRKLGGLVLLWLVARIAFLLHGDAAFLTGAICELLFYAGAAWAVGRAIYGTRNQRNYAVPLLILALGIADALFLLEAWRGDYAALMERFNQGLLSMALIALLVARRVIPFFASRGVQGLEIPMHVRSGQWQLYLTACALVANLLQWDAVTALALVGAGGISLWQWLSWKPLAVRGVPLLWILYLGYAMLGAGLLVEAAQRAGWEIRVAWPVHVIGIGGFTLLIIGMVTRTALGHLGRPLKTDRYMVASYLLMVLAFVLRLLALLPAAPALPLLHAAACAWIVSLALYLWRFVPYLIRPRADQPRGRVLKATQVRL